MVESTHEQEESEFADSDHRTAESAVSRELWRWAFSADEVRAGILAVGSKLSSTLEWHLCDLLQQVEVTRSRGIWCDGVVELSVQRLHRRAFLIVGASYSPHDLVPFEVEFHFARRRDFQPIVTMLRFGERDNLGEVRRMHGRAHTVVANRPRRNRDWAIAVELRSLDS